MKIRRELLPAKDWQGIQLITGTVRNESYKDYVGFPEKPLRRFSPAELDRMITAHQHARMQVEINYQPYPLFKQDFLDLGYADLRGHDFSGRNLRHSNFSHSDVRDADFTGSTLTASCMMCTDLRGAKGITYEMVRSLAWGGAYSATPHTQPCLLPDDVYAELVKAEGQLDVDRFYGYQPKAFSHDDEPPFRPNKLPRLGRPPKKAAP